MDPASMQERIRENLPEFPGKKPASAQTESLEETPERTRTAGCFDHEGWKRDYRRPKPNRFPRRPTPDHRGTLPEKTSVRNFIRESRNLTSSLASAAPAESYLRRRNR